MNPEKDHAERRTMTMETIELRPNLFRLTIRTFLHSFILFFVTKWWAYGAFNPADTGLVLRARAIEALIVTGVALLAILPFLKHRNALLTQHSLRARMRNKKFGLWKSNTVDLSEIVISRAFIDRLSGTQVATLDEKIVYINTIFYSKKQVRTFVDEIERRQSFRKIQPDQNQSL